MATKGASNRYGNSRGSSPGHITEHTGFAWAKGFNKTTLTDHYQRHGSQVQSDSEESYIAHPVKFANTVDERGSTYKYNKKTNEFAIITKKGVVVTYYKPEKGYKYYMDQKKMKGRNKHGK